MFQLNDKVAIITGSSRGIGKAIALMYAQAGAKVVVSSRKQDAVDLVVEEIQAAGGQAIGLTAHTGDKDAIHTLVEKTMSAFGRIDILVNNAATNPHFGTLLEAEDSLWEKTIQVNIMGNIWLCQACVPHMKSQGAGKIINIASVVGLSPGHYQGIYSMTKAGLISLTKTLAIELGPDNIQVNAIAPGLIKTKFASVLWQNETLKEQVESKTPAGRIGDPEDIAGMAVYLASDASKFTTGEVFVIDGGLTLGSL